MLFVMARSQEEGSQSLSQWGSFTQSHSKHQAGHQPVPRSRRPHISEIVCIGHFVIYTENHSFLPKSGDAK